MKNLRIAKQWGLEKMGRAEVVSESNTVRFLAEKNEESRTFLKDSYKRLEKQCKATQESVEEGKTTAAAFAHFGNRMKQAYDQQELGATMARLGQFQTTVESLKETLNRALTSDVSAPFEVLVRSDLAEAAAEKAKYDKYRRQYDAAMTRYRNAENKLKPGKSLAEEGEEVAEAKKELERVTEEVTAVLEIINKKTEMTLYERFHLMLTAYEDFFTRGAELVQEMKSHLARSQQNVEQAKAEYEELRARNGRGPGVGPVSPLTPKAAKRVFFGMPLADVMEGSQLPRAIQNAISFLLRPEVIVLEGLFRISGNISSVQQLQSEVDSGKDVDFGKVADPHCVAATLKLWIRSLPASLFPISGLTRYMALNLETTPEDEQVRVLQAAVEPLPETNKTALHAILYLCSEIAKRSEENRMTASNLSTVLGPNLFFCETTDPQEMMKAMQPSTIGLTLLIKRYDAFFPNPPSFLTDGSGAATGSPSTAAATGSPASPPPLRPVPSEAIAEAATMSPRAGSIIRSPSSGSTIRSPRPESTPPTATVATLKTPRGAGHTTTLASLLASAPSAMTTTSTTPVSTSTPEKPAGDGPTSSPEGGSRIRALTSSLSGSQGITSIVEGSQNLPTTVTPDNAERSFVQSDEVVAAEKEGSGVVTGLLVSSVTSLVATIAPAIHADEITDEQVKALNSELKAVAAALKEAFDQMAEHSTKRPATKSPMNSAARHLRPAAKNLLAAAKTVNETPGDRSARVALLAAARELVGATHALTVAASEVDSLACAPTSAEALLQQCAQHTGRLIHASTGNAAGDDVHATAFAALTAAEQLRYGTAAVAANLVNGPAALQLVRAGEDVERHLSQLSSLAVPLLGGVRSADLRSDPALKEAARHVANEFRTVTRLLKEAPAQPRSAPVAHADEAQLLQDAHAHLSGLLAQLEAEAPALTPEHAEILPRVRAVLDQLGLVAAAAAAAKSDHESWDDGAFTAVRRLAAEVALLAAECGGDDDNDVPVAARTVHYLRQVLLLAFAGAGARRLGEAVAKAPLASLPVPEVLHPSLIVAGLVASLSSLLRQLFFSSLVPSSSSSSSPSS